jgi:hypothetical protein
VKVNFQADNDLDRAIVRGVLRRRPTADFASQPLDAIDDLAVLGIAAQAGRVLVSHDISTMSQAFAQFRRGGNSPGVLLVPQLWALVQTIENLILIWDLTTSAEWADRICYLPTLGDFRIR